MPKLAANLTMLFGEVPFLDRFEAAARAGFKGVEYLFPYDHLALVLKQKLRDHGLVQVLHNLPAGHWAAGERGIACLPDRVDEFKTGVDQAIDTRPPSSAIASIASRGSSAGRQPGRRAGDVHEQPALRGARVWPRPASSC